MRILRHILLSFAAVGAASSQEAAQPSAPRIFRHILLTQDTVELGRPVGALLRYARSPTDSIITVPLGQFGGTDAIRIHRRASGEVASMVFLYGSRHSMAVLRDGYIEDLGTPLDVQVDTVGGVERRTWIWQDARTRFQLSALATPIDGVTGTAVMLDLTPRAP